ncbi:hypothetical protein PCAR4_190079 [Paraburkholderia caribensis]|nr:hypothetical protein PCAR4_190079 [Paraburkholderia caribensis]
MQKAEADQHGLGFFILCRGASTTYDVRRVNRADRMSRGAHRRYAKVAHRRINPIHPTRVRPWCGGQNEQHPAGHRMD